MASTMEGGRLASAWLGLQEDSSSAAAVAVGAEAASRSHTCPPPAAHLPCQHCCLTGSCRAAPSAAGGPPGVTCAAAAAAGPLRRCPMTPPLEDHPPTPSASPDGVPQVDGHRLGHSRERKQGCAVLCIDVNNRGPVPVLVIVWGLYEDFPSFQIGFDVFDLQQLGLAMLAGRAAVSLPPPAMGARSRLRCCRSDGAQRLVLLIGEPEKLLLLPRSQLSRLHVSHHCPRGNPLQSSQVIGPGEVGWVHSNFW
eukprot:CAMPEP_0117676990 /NCGR_PEP_ID=MMETSP0804-20121206/16506_1 /TAXON_ID=1074897 /ORGANISM="Tetraselmis astigmatica, Strain CCMP880" /LENGTH=251 /DNA_ID=CAMNT_0005486243 /DNA_START=438 /DNA_END=1192 /DNA_ORIENTATION=-